MRVLLTGASGFLGGAVARELLGRGHDVAALVRRPGSQPPGTTAIAGDLTDAAALRAAVATMAPDCVVHLAAEIATQKDAARLREVNVEGTRRLVDACRESTRPRVVFASTVVTGDARGRLLEEDTPLPVETEYGRTKQEGERLVRESGLDAIVIRPGHVYGPGGWFANEIVRRLRAPGRLVVVGRGDNLWDVVHVDDVATAIVTAAEGAPAGGLYHVADDEPLTLFDFVATAARALGVGPPRRVPVRLARLLNGRDPTAATVRSARTSNRRIKAELGWTPRYPSASVGVPAAIAALGGR
ncbi:MAG: NAD(P)-dependent oxidoreductase [Chloroflexi bacterium]|nr:MAG: NAD(P)-dependent oxidoreductase [Chloroflexota bacterium]